ncbi:signal peptide-containing protein [Theileria equi strain WA]|uniref:Signal peptide-containing protein n=1 Tax=Theileria equi strain WA TaxID=1537102 RepID=L0AZ16_THEEQ|nr:signal peptide-containing protein [Theileria equi strain WA]AFZ80805.1 signal peptide-containing protein [Theileria equi strain WA]|eukprot:XP_004830471.1 signal peptide-containing protein [Theileria equi strain WA]
MRLFILVPILATIKLCSAGWPCCCGGGNKDDDEGSDVHTRPRGAFRPKKVSPEHSRIYLLSSEDSVGHEGAQSNPQKPIILDLANPDKTNMNIYESDRNKVKYDEYFPNDGFYVSSVVKSGTEIWKAYGEEICTGASMYSKEDSSLLSLTIHSKSGFSVKCFERRDECWYTVGEMRSFLAKLDKMRRSRLFSSSSSGRSSPTLSQ